MSNGQTAKLACVVRIAGYVNGKRRRIVQDARSVKVKCSMESAL